jgi:hypothetical protein
MASATTEMNGSVVDTAKQETAAVEKEPSDTNKLKTFIGILRRYVSGMVTIYP